jgi:hypothetical protein
MKPQTIVIPGSRHEVSWFNLRFTIYDLRIVQVWVAAGILLTLGNVFNTTACAGEIFLRANQVGYAPRDAKIAVAFSPGEMGRRFSVADAESGKVVFSRSFKTTGGVTWGQFTNHAELDFSSFKKPGRYVLTLGGAKSFPFVISETVHATLPDQLLEFMRQQRCGYNPWLGTNCHQHDGRTAFGPLTNGTPLDTRGGWHDAGDLLKYLITSANATAQMLLAFELGTRNSERGTAPAFTDRCDALGNPGANGISCCAEPNRARPARRR